MKKIERATKAAGIAVALRRNYRAEGAYYVQVANESKWYFATAQEAVRFFNKVVKDLRADARAAA